MKKISFILALIVFSVGFTPAQANDQIIDQMVNKYLSNPGCATNIDNLLLEIFQWDGGDSNYKDCQTLTYGDPLSWAVPTVAFTSNDYKIWLKNCNENFFTYSCPQSLNKMNFDIKAYMKSLYLRYQEAQKSQDGIDIYYTQSMESWPAIYKDYYPSQKHNCKPLKPFYYTSKTGRYIASATQISKTTVVVTAGPEYKTYKYTYTKKEQKENMDYCLSQWKSDHDFAVKIYTQYKEMYINRFKESKYASGRDCNVLNQVIEFKDIATVKCIKNVWVQTK